jgi:excisionase family DNA binding protein
MAKIIVRHENTISESGPLIDPRAFGLVKAAYSVNATIDLLSIGRTTFYALVGRGDLKITKLGKKSLVYATDIAALLTKLHSAEQN